MIKRLPATQGLQALLAELTGYPVGLRTVPLDNTGQPVLPPYTLLDSLPRTDATDTLADDGRSAIVDYQATFVSGPTAGNPDSRGGGEQADWLADRGWKVLERPADGSTGYAHPIDVGTGQQCYHREAREPGGTQDPNDGIMTSVIRYRLYLEATA